MKMYKESSPLFAAMQDNSEEDYSPHDDVPSGKKFQSLAQRIPISAPILEFLGSLILVFSLCITSVMLDNILATAIAIGALVVLLVYVAGHISGAHFNPAVSFSMFLRGRISVLSFLLYALVQLFGGIFGALLAYGVTEKRVRDSTRGSFCPQINQNATTYPFAFICEALWTCLLCYVSLGVATTKSQERNQYFGLAIGCTVGVGIIVLQPITGAVFNPIIATSACITNAMLTSKLSPLSEIWIYCLSEMIGAALATILYLLTTVDELKSLCRNFSWQDFLI